MSDRKLIVNADDFGISKETNRAIEELFEAGRITSTSILATAEATEQACEIAKRNRFSVGVHLTLNSDFREYPWVSLSHAKGLSNKEGYLHAETKTLAKFAKGKGVTMECEKQISLIKEKGVEIDHLDNHCGTMYGINMRAFFINAFRLAKKHNLPFRFPIKGYFLNDYFDKGVPKYIKLAHKGIVIVGKIIGARLIDNLISNPYAIKDIDGYKALEDYYLNAITNLKKGVSEMFLHPSYDSPKFSEITLEWKKRIYELEFLFSDAFLRRLSDEGIQLISYKDI